MKYEIAQNIINQIEDMEWLITQTRKNLASGSGSLDLANMTIEKVWTGAAKIRVALSNLDKELEKLENIVDEKNAIRLASQKL